MRWNVPARPTPNRSAMRWPPPRSRSTDLTKLLGYDIEIDAKGQNPKKRYVMQQINDGKYYTVWPENVAVKNYKMVWPANAAQK